VSAVGTMAMTGLIQDCKSSRHGAPSLCCFNGICYSLNFPSKLSSVHTCAPTQSERSILIRNVNLQTAVLEVSGTLDWESNHFCSEEIKSPFRTEFNLNI